MTNKASSPPAVRNDATDFRPSEADFRLLAENIGEVFWFLELDPFRVSYVSPAFERIWGLKAEELYEDHKIWERSIHPDDLPAVREAFKSWVEGGSAVYRVQYRVRHADGSVRWIADRGIVIGHENGRPTRLSGIAVDITERMTTEEALAEKARQMNAIVEGTHDGIAIADVETRRLTFANAAFCRIAGLSIEEIPEISVENLHPAGELEAIQAKFDAMGRGELRVAEDIPILRKDGTVAHVDVSAGGIVVDGRPCLVGVFHDLTERRRAEQKFRALLESAPDAMMIHAGDGRIQIVNAQAEKLFGYSREELIGQTMEMLVPERFRSVHVEHRKRYVPQAKPRPMGRAGMTLVALHKDGHEIPVDISLSNLEGNHEVMVISSIRDISERKRAEEAVRDSEKRYRGFFDNVGVGAVHLDANGRYYRVNDRYCDIVGYSREELLAGMTPRLLEHPEDREKYGEIFEHFMRGEMDTYDVEKRYVRKDGRVVWVHVSATAVRKEGGAFSYSVGLIEDITERREAEEAVRESERFAKSTIEAIPARLAVLGGDGRIVSCNDAWARFDCHHCGFPCAPESGSDYLAVCDVAAASGNQEASRYAEGVRGVLSGELSRFSMEFPCHAPEEQRWFVAYVTPFLGEGPRRAVIAHLDISQRKRAEQVIRRLNDELEKRVEERTAQLRESNENLRREMDARLRLEEEILEISEREQQRIGRDLHDDLGQQIVGVWCLGKVLQNNLESAGRPEATDAAKMTDILERALLLTRNLSRGLQPVALETGGLIAALKDLATRTTEILGIPCQFHEDAPEFEPDNTTATHLYRIAQEAVTNAVKHAKCTRIDLNLTSADGGFALSIIDNGRGMVSPAGSNAGMGLRTMRYRADIIGGELSVALASPHGTVITCLFESRTKKPRTGS